MTDIVDRLRFLSAMIQNSERLVWGSDSAAMDEAADEIERLRVALREIKEQDIVEIALDPEWPRRIAHAALIDSQRPTEEERLVFEERAAQIERDVRND